MTARSIRRIVKAAAPGARYATIAEGTAAVIAFLAGSGPATCTAIGMGLGVDPSHPFAQQSRLAHLLVHALARGEIHAVARPGAARTKLYSANRADGQQFIAFEAPRKPPKADVAPPAVVAAPASTASAPAPSLTAMEERAARIGEAGAAVRERREIVALCKQALQRAREKHADLLEQVKVAAGHLEEVENRLRVNEQDLDEKVIALAREMGVDQG